MKFRTEIAPLNHNGMINYESEMITMGSCFSENIGLRLQDHQFKVKVNPFGIVFNPLSLLKHLQNTPLNDKHFVERGDRAVSMDFHSRYQFSGVEQFKKQYQIDQLKFQADLRNTSVLCLTFGTAWVYRFKESDQVVSNCQKVPGYSFTKELLDIGLLQQAYQDYFTILLEENPTLKIILTVSPVRHIKDGLIENTLSKSTLLLLSHFLAKTFPDNVIYYPAYEIVLDDLRDYRFFKKDLIHPNDIAVDYVYEHFKDSFLTDREKNIIILVDKLERLQNHKDINSSETEKLNREQKLSELRTEIETLKLS